MTATAQKSGRRGKKNPVVPSHDEVIAMVLELGGEAEKKRYEKIDGLQKGHSKEDVLYHWRVGSILAESFKEHDEETIRVYAIALQRARNILKQAVRLAQLYKEPKIREMLKAAADGGHELSWNHFRRLLNESLTEADRGGLVMETIAKRWGYRDLEQAIHARFGGKKSQGGRKSPKPVYKTYAQALSAMQLRSREWLRLEETWIDQVKGLAAKLDDDQRHTAEFVKSTRAAAEQLRSVAIKAQRDAEEAEALAAAAAGDAGDVAVEEEEKPARAPRHAGNGRAHTNGKPKTKTKPRIRLARHPKMENGKVVKS
jgi:hypothetical protein